MRKYKWSLLKSLEFLNSRRPDLEIRATFIHQLSAYEARLQHQMKLPISSKWDELSNTKPTFACEELLLRNTFVNSQNVQIPPPQKDDEQTGGKPRAIRWADEPEKGEEPAKKKDLVTNLSEADEMADLIYKDPNNLNAITTHKDLEKLKGLKSAIKSYKIDNN